MKSINRADAADTNERLARLERKIEEYHATTERQLLRRAIKLWRRAEAQQKLVNLGKERERIN